MRVTTLIVPAALLSLAALAAHADTTERYRLEKSGDGYVRMDTQTGAMSSCSEKDGQLICRMAADERSAMQDEVDRLQGQIDVLNERVGKLENSLSAKLESSLPSEEDFDKTMGYMERFLRRFMDIAKDLDKDNGDGAKLQPQKT